LKSGGKMPSLRAKLIIVVIGLMRASMHDLRRNVGITSNEQVALVDDIIMECTSSVEARVKEERENGGGDAVVCGGDVSGGKEADKRATLSLK
jgi:hypothetical protein